MANKKKQVAERKYSKHMPKVVVAGSLFFSLLFIEIVMRFLYQPSHQDLRAEVFIKESLQSPELAFSMDCYPSDPDNQFSFDLNKAEDIARLRNLLGMFANDDFGVRGDFQSANNPNAGIKRLSFQETVEFLKKNNAHCVLHDIRKNSPRIKFFQPNPRFQAVALLGDSFAWGQGVGENETYVAHLSRSANANIYNYGRVGANMMAIYDQFKAAMADHATNKFSNMIYLFVLNDPLMTNEVRRAQHYIDDFMNIRWYLGKKSVYSSWWVRSMVGVSEYSSLLGFLFDRFVLWNTRRKTIEWYHSIFDETRNSRFSETLNIIKLMSHKARQHGISFQLALYPLMTDLKDYPFKKIHTRMRQFCAQKGVSCIDLLPAFEATNETKLTVHLVDYHPNGRAHKIAAEETAKNLIIKK